MAAKLHTLVEMPQAEVGIAAVAVHLPELLEHVEWGAADNTVCPAQPFQQLRGHAEPVVGDIAGAAVELETEAGGTAGAAVKLEAEVVGNAVAIDLEHWKLPGCILVLEVADMSQALHTAVAEELRLKLLHERLREIVDIVDCFQLLHLFHIQMAGHLGLEAGHWDCRTYLGLEQLISFNDSLRDNPRN